MKDKRPIEASKTVMTQLVMPNDTNPLGNLMGGHLMSWMDVAAAICAAKHCGEYVTTAGVDNLAFKKSVQLGEVVTLKATVTRAFKTSMEIYVEVFANDMRGGNQRRTTEAYFTFVAIDADTGKPCPVPDVLPLTGEEQKLYDGASKRRELRFLLSGRLKPSDAHEIRELFE